MRNDNSGPSDARRYDANYGNFQSELYSEIRRQAYGEDIGQNSWLTANEHDKFLSWLGLSAGMKLLDVACGAGGPALRAAEKMGCNIVGVDVHENAIGAANAMAAELGLLQRAVFLAGNAAERLPFLDASFDAIICIDAINHLSKRRAVFTDWFRLLKPHGKLLFTDPIVVTGPLTNQEIKARGMGGFYLFVPQGYNEMLLSENGFALLRCEDATKNMALVAERRSAARARREKELREIEGDSGFEEQQSFLATAHLTASESRLSRFAFLGEKSG
jgi:ubiquinone/menaquinone biosynthesis C-methylase UbiE